MDGSMEEVESPLWCGSFTVQTVKVFGVEIIAECCMRILKWRARLEPRISKDSSRNTCVVLFIQNPRDLLFWES